jgi:hypothetical protein
MSHQAGEIRLVGADPVPAWVCTTEFGLVQPGSHGGLPLQHLCLIEGS